MPDLIGIDLRLNPLADLSTISGLKNITYLSVSSNDLAPIYNFSKLEKLGLANVWLDNSQLQELDKALPDCKIYFTRQ
jgi:Leucine-rich repeat (LRR) protein